MACNLVRRTNSVEGGKQHVAAMKAAWKGDKAKLTQEGLLERKLKAVPTEMDNLLIE